MIRLARIGARKQPYYRIVVIEKDRARNGRSIEVVGTYNPRTNPASVELKHERIAYWRGVGAQMTPIVEKLVTKIPAPAAHPGTGQPGCRYRRRLISRFSPGFDPLPPSAKIAHGGFARPVILFAHRSKSNFRMLVVRGKNMTQIDKVEPLQSTSWSARSPRLSWMSRRPSKWNP